MYIVLGYIHKKQGEEKLAKERNEIERKNKELEELEETLKEKDSQLKAKEEDLKRHKVFQTFLENVV